MLNNKMTVTVSVGHGIPCAIPWCPHDARFHILAEADGCEPFEEDICPLHFTQMCADLANTTEQKWVEGVYPDRPPEPTPHIRPREAVS